MKKVLTTLIITLLAGHACLYSESLSDTLDTSTAPRDPQISEAEMSMPVFNNRILTRVNGEPISLYDVTKKMDFIFFQQFPQYASSTPARLQFYQMHWRSFLDNVVEEKLLIADAKEKKFGVRDGEVREELERMFGPNVIENIESAGLAFADAWDMVRNHLTVQRMSYIAVHMKAKQRVSPDLVRAHYKEHIDQFTRPPELEYQVVSVKGSDELECSYLTNLAIDKMVTEKKLGEDLKKELEEKASLAKVSLYGPYQRTEKDISEAHLKELKALQPGECSKPAHTAKESNDGKEFYGRIFYLNNITEPTEIPFEELESVISEGLLQEAINDLSIEYLNELKERFGVDKAELRESIPEDYQPFST